MRPIELNSVQREAIAMMAKYQLQRKLLRYHCISLAKQTNITPEIWQEKLEALAQEGQIADKQALTVALAEIDDSIAAAARMDRLAAFITRWTPIRATVDMVYRDALFGVQRYLKTLEKEPHV